MIPVEFDEDGWFTAGKDGTTSWHYELPGDFTQERRQLYTFSNTDWNKEWIYLRHPDTKNYELSEKCVLYGSEISLNDVDSPTFIGLRQIDFNMELSVKVSIDKGEAGVTVYSCENEHYDLFLRKTDSGSFAVLRLNIGGIHHEEAVCPVSDDEIKLIIKSESCKYHFYIECDGKETELGLAMSKYLSSEVSGGFTGVVVGLFAVGDNKAVFSEYEMKYLDWEPELWMNQD